jgi:anti-anti-sigma factor
VKPEPREIYILIQTLTESYGKSQFKSFKTTPGKVLEKNNICFILSFMNGHFNIYGKSSILVVEVLVDKFDFLELSESSRYLRNLLEKRDYPSAIFDLLRVTFIDSSVFGFLLDMQNRAKKKGNKITIVCADKAVLHVMAMLTIPEIIRVFPGLEEAEKYLTV